jgi:hypothetical protein
VRRISPLLVGVALVALAAAQAVAVTRDRALPAAAAVAALPNGYSYATRPNRLMVVGFQLRNTGSVPLRVRGLGADLPGLRLADAVVSGEPFAFSSAGEGKAPLPPFALDPGVVIEVTLVYELRSCGAVPTDLRPMPLLATADGGAGRLDVPLPTAPADDPDAGPDDEEQWQNVLVRDLCG